MAGREAFCELDWDTMEHSFHRRRQHKALIIGKKMKKIQEQFLGRAFFKKPLVLLPTRELHSIFIPRSAA